VYAAVHKELCEFREPACAFDVVAVAASAGGIEALRQLLTILPKDFPAAILVVQHLPSKAHHTSVLDVILGRHTPLCVKWAEDGERIRPGTVFLAPQDRHLFVDSAGALHLTAGPKINRVRPAADPLFKSIAARFAARAIAVVLSGALYDGAEGAWEIARNGGRILAQDEISSQCFSMPEATRAAAGVDFMFAPAIIAHTLVNLVMVPGAADWLRVHRFIRPQFHARSRTALTPLWCEDPAPP
jgi:two-component system chemotaxis response regulator CheB